MPHSKGFGGRRERRSGDPVPLGEIVDGLLSEPAFARGLPVAALARRWPEIVGERLAAATAPHTLEQGLLTVRATDGPWGAQARFMSEEIRSKADEALGGGQIRTIRIVVVPADGNRW